MIYQSSGCTVCGKPATQFVAVDIAAAQHPRMSYSMQPRCCEHGFTVQNFAVNGNLSLNYQDAQSHSAMLEAENARLQAQMILWREEIALAIYHLEQLGEDAAPNQVKRLQKLLDEDTVIS